MASFFSNLGDDAYCGLGCASPSALLAVAHHREAGYREHRAQTPEEPRLAHEDALERGKKLAASLLNGFKNNAPVASIQEPEYGRMRPSSSQPGTCGCVF
ncbi:MAG TPA: hypothetical protein VGV35_14655 [Bryobacteraceae bacterium]|nr:hypothetical protein [Bryobacteraceae bacterium]